MTDGISYRLGYLNGRVRAYEREEDLKKLVEQSTKLQVKRKTDKPGKNVGALEGSHGEKIIL